MTNPNYEKRINSFFDLDRAITKEKTSDVKFTEREKLVYKDFAESIAGIFAEIEHGSEYKTDIEIIISELEKVHRNSILEDFIRFFPVTISNLFPSL